MLLSALAIALVLAAASPAAAETTKPAPQVAQAPISCEKADALLRVGEDEPARKAYVGVLEAEPASSCAEAGLEEVNADPASFKSDLEEVVESLPSIISVLGLLLLAVFLVAMLGHIPVLRAFIRRLPYIGKWIGPRMSIEKFEDEAIDGKPGAPIAARIKERLHRLREEAIAADGSNYGIDASLPREEFADQVSENSGLKNSLEKASDISDQTKIVAAILNLIYALLPIQRISVAATMEPPVHTGPAATLIIEENARLKAATTVRGPQPATGDPTAADYSRLADPAAVWVQYEVARILAKKPEDAAASKAYALVREGLDFQLADDWLKARERYLKAIGLNPRSWAAYVNLAVADAWLAQDFDTSIAMLRLGLSEVMTPESA